MLGDEFYFIVDCVDGIFMSSITVNENNINKCDFSRLSRTPAGAIQKYKEELFQILDDKLCKLHDMEGEKFDVGKSILF
jgi:hypothetical protein